MWKPVMRDGKWVVVDHDDRTYPRILLGHDDKPLAFRTYVRAQDEADTLNRPQPAN
jgi:hypothetical protein